MFRAISCKTVSLFQPSNMAAVKTLYMQIDDSRTSNPCFVTYRYKYVMAVKAGPFCFNLEQKGILISTFGEKGLTKWTIKWRGD